MQHHVGFSADSETRGIHWRHRQQKQKAPTKTYKTLVRRALHCHSWTCLQVEVIQIIEPTWRTSQKDTAFNACPKQNTLKVQISSQKKTIFLQQMEPEIGQTCGLHPNHFPSHHQAAKAVASTKYPHPGRQIQRILQHSTVGEARGRRVARNRNQRPSFSLEKRMVKNCETACVWNWCAPRKSHDWSWFFPMKQYTMMWCPPCLDKPTFGTCGPGGL